MDKFMVGDKFEAMGEVLVITAVKENGWFEYADADGNHVFGQWEWYIIELVNEYKRKAASDG